MNGTAPIFNILADPPCEERQTEGLRVGEQQDACSTRYFARFHTNSNVTPAGVLAEQHRKMAEPGSAKKAKS